MCSSIVTPYYIYRDKMEKQKYIVPSIEKISQQPEGDTCGVPVFFSTLGPGIAGAKRTEVEVFDDDDDDADESAQWLDTKMRYSACEK